MSIVENLLCATVPLSETESAELFFTDETSYDVFDKIWTGSTYPFGVLNNLVKANNKVIVDIGANVGGFSLFAARLWKGSTVYAFEPGDRAFQCLYRNLAHAPGARAYPFGLARGDHKLMLHGSSFGSVCGSVCEVENHDPDTETIEIRDAASSLAKLGIGKIDILKIDTEGCEVPILRSLEELLPKTGAILLEYHKEDDRRTIDNMLAPTHYLCRAKVTSPHRGEFVYISREIISGAVDNIRIDLPEALSAA